MLLNIIRSGKGFQDILLTLCLVLLAILLSLSFHEFMHAVAATRLGDSTPRAMGRLTMNPVKHIDPIGLVMMMLAGFGWARPVMINSRNFKKPRRDDILVSVAGPVGNLILALTAYLIMEVCFLSGISHPIIFNILYYVYVYSICFMVFNILPIPPLDGYHIFKDATIRTLPHSFFSAYERYGFIVLIALILTGTTSGILSGVMNFMIGLMDPALVWHIANVLV